MRKLLLILLALTMFGSMELPRAMHDRWFSLIAPTSGVLQAQQAPVSAVVAPGSYTFTAAGTGGTINLTGSGTRYHEVYWNAVGNLSACGFVIQTATNSGGLTWTTLAPTSATFDCTKRQGSVFFADAPVNYVRIQLPTYTCAAGGTCNVTLAYRGYKDDPTVTRNIATTAAITLASQGVTQIVAAQTDKIAVTFAALAVTVGSGTGQGIIFVQGTGVNCATNPVNLTGRLAILAGATGSTPAIVTLGNGVAAIVTQTTSAQALCLATDTTESFGGWVTWIPTP